MYVSFIRKWMNTPPVQQQVARILLNLLDRIVSFHELTSNKSWCHFCVDTSVVSIKKGNLAILYVDEVERNFARSVSMVRIPIKIHLLRNIPTHV